MASFTDTNLPTFNPYVQQLPVEAMVQVGMQKQAQYEQGVTKIQNQIDNIAGMDVMRDVDKNYLQSKLNQLGNDLTTVAAGDFSNFQLVNSVGGMATQISKDKYVQNAVGSAARYRKEAALMEKARAEGKSSQANIYDFSTKANSWLESESLDESFNGRYTQYIDVDKKMLDVLKQLHPNLTEQDIPYEKNADGSLNYNKIASAMQRVTKETVSANQIENAVRASLTPDEMNQLSINARYTFRGIQTPEQLQEYSRTKFGSQIGSIDEKINKLEGYKNLVTSNSGEYTTTVSMIDDLKVQKGQLQNSLNEELEAIAANPDEAKFQIYKNGAISQFADAFSWQTYETQLLTNPVLEAQHWEKTYALDQSKFALSVRSQNWTEYKGQFDMNMADKNYNLAVKKQLTDLYGAQSGMAFYGGKSTFIKDPAVAMNNDINANKTIANNKFNEILKGVPNVTAAMLEKNLTDYANGDKTALSKIPVEWRDEANAILTSRAEAKRLQSALDEVDREIINTPETQNKKKQLEAELATRPPLKLGNETFSQKEIFNFLDKETYLSSQGGTGGGAPGQINVDQSKLSEKEKVLYNALRSSRYSVANPYYPKKETESDKLLNAVVQRYTPVLNQYKVFNQDITAKRNKKLLEKTGAYVPAMYNINVSNKDGATSRDTWEGIAGSALMIYEEKFGGIKGGAAELSQDDITKGRKWLTQKAGKDDLQYKKLVQGDKTFLVMTNGDEEVVVPLPEVIVNQLPTNENEVSGFNKKIKKAQQLGGGSTNPKLIPDIAIVQRWDFPNVKNLNVVADVKSNKSNSGKNYLVFNLRTPSGWQSLSMDNYPLSIDNIEKTIQTATDAEIKSYFLNNATVSASVKEEIKNL
jgi:hypothetical protein